MNEKLLRKYAKLAVRTGANIQPGQLLVISASVEDHDFVKMCVEEAYKALASEVMVNWSSEDLILLDYTYCSIETLTEIPDYAYDKRKYVQDKGCAFLHIANETPGLMAGIDPEKIMAGQVAAMKKFKPLQNYTLANHGQWSVVALPSVTWAKKVFPEKTADEALKLLWDAILMSVRIDEENDPVEEWKIHNEKLRRYCNILNEHNFDKLHFESSTGTDLYVGLIKNHIWEGGSGITTKGVVFNPNMPTEEVFTMPDKNNVSGKVVATKPLSYNGKLIENFWFIFEDGKVVDYGAEKEFATLTSLLDTDEGSKRIGEVALISHNSPISLSNILFYNTLFDENASCHLALGQAYPENIKGGTEMTEEQLKEAGANDSMNHVDFMFGSEDMKITGIKADGEEVSVFEKGNFIL
ncbi:MAG: aminopeptidase [Erysipelotrichaceae bacterium]|jgi:aminopeptidase